ncbi:MAG: xanthine dehydrogenase family protein subunit M [Deltaproteobacteria bacterium]|nr:xanthine dehydrogenase family protein subunit M [Deltaproteobacteria bacterium]
MRDFDYLCPQSLKEALAFLEEHGENCRIIAGGQSLLNILKQGLIAPEVLVDIKSIPELDYVRCDEAGQLRVGAVTTHRALELSPLVRERFGVLADMEQHLASVQIRNWGTIGGNLCIADPTGDPAPPLIAMGGQVTIASTQGERSLAIRDLFVDYYETVVKPQELLTEIVVPPLPERSAVTYAKFRNVEGDSPIVGAAVFLEVDPDGSCLDVRIALGGVAPTPVRAEKAEGILRGKFPGDGLIEKAAEAVADDISPIPDIVASEEYKEKVARVLVKRMLREARERLKG